MNESLAKLIGEYFAKLPPETQKIVSDMKWAQAVQDIGKKYGLKLDQIGNLMTEITMALLGIVHPDEFNDMVYSFGMPKDTAQAMITDLEREIFWPIRKQLIDTFSDNVQEEVDRQENQTEGDLQKIFAMKSSDSKVLADSGISIMSDTPAGNAIPESIQPKRAEVMASIENPPKNTAIPLNAIPRPTMAEMPKTVPPIMVTPAAPMNPIQTTTPQSPLGQGGGVNAPINPALMKDMPMSPNVPKVTTMGSGNMVDDKLSAPFGMPQNTTDYTTPNMNAGSTGASKPTTVEGGGTEASRLNVPNVSTPPASQNPAMPPVPPVQQPGGADMYRERI